MSEKLPSLSEILRTDDAARHLKTLTHEERVPRYSSEGNVVVRPTRSFTQEEIQLAIAVTAPKAD